MDNDAAKECLIKGTTKSKASAQLVANFWCKAAEAELFIWVERDASAANPADAPFRRACPELKRRASRDGARLSLGCGHFYKAGG